MKCAAVSSLFIVCVFSISAASNTPEKAAEVKIYCPVVGLPESKSCCCPSSYCSFKPKAAQTVEYQGARVQFCCGKCAKMFKETPGKFAVAANHQLVATKQARQEKCPLCGGKVDTAVVNDIGGVKVSFCSEACHKKVTDASPAERVNLIFGEKAFARGFVIKATK